MRRQSLHAGYQRGRGYHNCFGPLAWFLPIAPGNSGPGIRRGGCQLGWTASYPERVRELEADGLLEVPSEHASRESARRHVSTPGLPGNAEGTRFFDSAGRSVGLAGRSGLFWILNRSPRFVEFRRLDQARGSPPATRGRARYCARPAMPGSTRNSSIQNRQSATTLPTREPTSCSAPWRRSPPLAPRRIEDRDSLSIDQAQSAT